MLIAFRIKAESEAEMQGFYQAMDERVMKLQAPTGKPLPVVISTYNGARRQANLTPLLALLLAKEGVPVLVQRRDQRPQARHQRRSVPRTGYPVDYYARQKPSSA